MQNQNTIQDNIPVFERDQDTGLIKGLEYPRRPDGRIQWEKLIPHEHIVFNTQNPKVSEEIERIYGRQAKSLVYSEIVAEGLEVNPKHILVLLQGFYEVFAIRGGSAIPRIAHVVSYPPEAAISVCECTIEWHPNIEEPNGFSSYGTADATMENTGGWGYLSAMAGNRAFVRAVKQGLRIPILGFDEIAKKDTAIPESSNVSSKLPVSNMMTPSGSLERHATEAKFTFSAVKTGASTKYKEKIEGNPELWTTWTDISPRDCWTLITIIKEREDQEKKKLKK
jgi:hypothetical protein